MITEKNYKSKEDNMKVDRKTVRLFKRNSESAEEPVRMTQSEAISFLWELTEEVFSLSGGYDVKSRLQRHVVSITRKQS